MVPGFDKGGDETVEFLQGEVGGIFVGFHVVLHSIERHKKRLFLFPIIPSIKQYHFYLQLLSCSILPVFPTTHHPN